MLTDAFYGCEKVVKHSGFVIYSYLKDSAFKRDTKLLTRFVKGVPFVNRRYRKGVPFR